MTRTVMICVMAAALSLAGCKSGNPHSDDLFGAISGLTSGDYKKRSQEQQDRLLQTQYETGKTQEQGQRMTVIAADEQQRIDKLQQQVAALQTQANDLRRRINKLTANRSDLEAQQEALRTKYDAVQAELDDLKKRIAAGEPSSGLAGRKAALEDEVKRLRKELDVIEAR